MKLWGYPNPFQNGKIVTERGPAAARFMTKPCFAAHSAYARETGPRRSYAPQPNLC